MEDINAEADGPAAPRNAIINELLNVGQEDNMEGKVSSVEDISRSAQMLP